MAYLDGKQSLGQVNPAFTSGNEWFVSSVSGGASGNGKSWATAVTTIALALGLASAGDTIYVAGNHVETISAAGGINISKAGVSVIGLGRGSRKPTITVGGATSANMNISAANVLLRNFRFVSAIDSLVNFLVLNADYPTVEDCDFITASTFEATSFIKIATTKDYQTIRRCRFEQPTDPTGTDGNADTGCIYIVDSEYILVEDCWFNGNFETAIFHNKTTACKNLWVRNCHGIQALSGAEPFQLVAAANGGAYGGMFITPAETSNTEATLAGTIGDGFFISPTCTFGNDGLAGGQGGIVIATAS